MTPLLAAAEIPNDALALPTSFGLAAVVFLVLANGFFVATEFAIVAVRRSRLEQLAAEGLRSAIAARDVVHHLDIYIAACQLGITMASLGLGWIGEPALAHVVGPPLQLVFGSFAPGVAHSVAVGMSFALITALHIVIGELAPKGLALQRPETTSLWVARPLRLFYRLFRWPIAALNAVGNGALRLFGLDPSTGHDMVHSVEELRMLVHASQAAGTVEASEARIASRAFQFADLTAGELMTPRSELEAIGAATPLAELRARLATHAHHQVPVYETSPDDVIGVLHVRDVAAFDGAAESFDVRRLMRAPLVVAPTAQADELLEQFRNTGAEMAVVFDEYGSTVGVVTLHDILEGLVGPIARTRRAGPTEPDGSMLLDGRMRIAELESVSGVTLSPTDRARAATLGGLFMSWFARVPRVGDQIEVGGRALRVESMERHRVRRVRLMAATHPAASLPG